VPHRKSFSKTDYIHGEEVVKTLASQPRRIGFIVDGISKSSFFDVIKKAAYSQEKHFLWGTPPISVFTLSADV